MKVLATLLLLVNLAVFAYLQLDGLGRGDADRVTQQLNPDQLKPFTHAQVKAMGLDKPAPPMLCLDWGPFAEGEKARAQAAFEAIAEGRSIGNKAVEVTTAFWVYVPPLPNKAAADKKMAELKALGIAEMYLVQDNGPQKFAISLGLFRSEEAANNYLASVIQLGVKSARLAPRTQTLSQTVLLLRDPPPGALDRVQRLKADFPGAEAKQGACNGRAANGG
ncbi:hypothetical protein BURK2_03370 [Burkholderiales bacterium]|nr:MAG: SPOR domain-containing protein [Burkholderiales bacterium]CAG1005264.1 hypothetical protein BURK2_03370 [Burkholderiales bacterium]